MNASIFVLAENPNEFSKGLIATTYGYIAEIREGKVTTKVAE